MSKIKNNYKLSQRKVQHTKFKHFVFRTVLIIIIFSPVLAFGQAHQKEINKIETDQFNTMTPEEIGVAIAEEAERRESGFGDFTADLVMVLNDRHGKMSTRVIRNKVLENIQSGDKSMFIFDRPVDIKGSALLTHSSKQGSDLQWLFLPAVKRVKRISSNNKSGPFMGSEFAYEDLSSEEMENYTYNYLKQTSLDEEECFMVERYPVDRNSGYNRQIVWYTKNEFIIKKIEYYDRKDILLKTLTFSSYNLYLDKYWRAHNLLMVNHQSGKTTQSLWSNFKFQTGLTDTDFDTNSLKMVR